MSKAKKGLKHEHIRRILKGEHLRSARVFAVQENLSNQNDVSVLIPLGLNVFKSIQECLFWKHFYRVTLGNNLFDFSKRQDVIYYSN